MIRIAGGLVLTSNGMVEADVWIDGPTVVSVGSPPGHGAAARVVDAGGMLVGPGLVDLHTHLRDPGHTWKEDVATGSRAAAAGGYTAVVAMPNTDPALDRPDLAYQVRRRGAAVGLVKVEVAAALTQGRRGTRPTDVAALYRAGIRMFTDDGDGVTDPEVLGHLMRQVAELPGALVAQHAEDPQICGGGHMHEGEISARLGIPGIPAQTEHAMVERDLGLARLSGVRYHVQHVSSARTVEMIAEAREAGMAVTSEVTPHHLTFEVSSLSTLAPDLKMYPPIRSAGDRHALREALRDGTIDVVATDHAPHTAAEKSVRFVDAPRGVIGLETAAAAVWEVVGEPYRFFEVLSLAPARIAGIARHGIPLSPGSAANLMIFDPAQTWVPEQFHSRSSNSPYRGREMRGRVAATIFEGVVTHELEGAR